MDLMHFGEVDDRIFIPSAMTALSSMLLVLHQRFSNPFSRNRLALKGQTAVRRSRLCRVGAA